MRVVMPCIVPVSLRAQTSLSPWRSMARCASERRTSRIHSRKPPNSCTAASGVAPGEPGGIDADAEDGMLDDAADLAIDVATGEPGVAAPAGMAACAIVPRTHNAQAWCGFWSRQTTYSSSVESLPQ